ncbi:MAG TPA: protein phosphatase 2C domain-containing protein [Acidimicrobiales bacterium]|nr:protein phosphatase 2C domain-containing protein [Acidimicrobiales bacterium]
MEPPLRSGADAASASYRAEGGTTGWCSLTAATVTGVGHRLTGETGQDSFAWAVAGERLAVAVADGLGSVPGSTEAAAAATRTAVRAATALPQGQPREAAMAGIDAAETEMRGREAGSGATTLVVCVLDQGGDAALSRVGDSTAFVFGSGGGRGWRELFDPPADHEEEMPVATGALASGEGRVSAVAETVEVTLSGSEILAVVSDGVAGPWRDGPTTVAPAMVEGLMACPSPIELAALVDFSRQGCHDDRTMVAIRPVGEWSGAELYEAEG